MRFPKWHRSGAAAPDSQRREESQGKRQTPGIRHEKGGNVSYAISDSLNRPYLPYASMLHNLPKLG